MNWCALQPLERRDEVGGENQYIEIPCGRRLRSGLRLASGGRRHALRDCVVAWLGPAGIFQVLDRASDVQDKTVVFLRTHGSLVAHLCRRPPMEQQTPNVNRCTPADTFCGLVGELLCDSHSVSVDLVPVPYAAQRLQLATRGVGQQRRAYPLRVEPRLLAQRAIIGPRTSPAGAPTNAPQRDSPTEAQQRHTLRVKQIGRLFTELREAVRCVLEARAVLQSSGGHCLSCLRGWLRRDCGAVQAMSVVSVVLVCVCVWFPAGIPPRL